MSFYFPDFVSVIVTGWQDFAASLTGKCLSAFLVLSTNYMPHKINRPLYIPQYIESLHHRMTEISFNFINILNPFPNYFSYFFISLRESSSFKSNALFCNAPISLPNFLKLDFSLRRLRYSLWNMHVMKLFIMAKKADKVAIFQYQMFASSLTANTVIPINRNTPVK